MIVLDTTVLVYAVGYGHPLRDACRSVISAIGAGRLIATTTAEVLQEFTHVRARRRSRKDAAALADAHLDLLGPLLTIEADDLSTGLRLFQTHDALGSFDAVLAATAMRREHISALVSANRAFAAVPGLRHLDPAHADFITDLDIA